MCSAISAYSATLSNRRQGQWNAIVRIYRFRFAGRTVSHIDNFLVRESLFTCTFSSFRAFTHIRSSQWLASCGVYLVICRLKWIYLNSFLRIVADIRTCLRRSRITIQTIIGHFVNCRSNNGDSLSAKLSTRQFYHTFAYMFTFAAINNQTKHLCSVNKRMGQWWNACVCAWRASSASCNSIKPKWKVKVAKS